MFGGCAKYSVPVKNLYYILLVTVILFYTDYEQPVYYYNADLENIVTPVDADHLKELLVHTKYNPEETHFFVDGFRSGFDLEYQGPTKRTSTVKNIPFTVGNSTILWNKLMKEVKLKRIAGPFDRVPFKYFIQSPIDLVPKAGGQTRLIFHLSYEFGPNEQSVNHHTPREKCSVKYCNLDHAVQNFLRVHEQQMGDSTQSGTIVIYAGKADLKSAFRVLPLKKSCWAWLIMAVQDPTSGEWKYFVAKCLPFGSSISCAHFQRFSDGLKHIVQFRTSSIITNYLDDFVFVAATIARCNYLLR